MPVIARFCLLVLAWAVVAPRPGAAMEFALRDGTVFGSGEIVAGDTARFQQFLKDQKVPPAPDGDVTVHLSGSGGDGIEGIAFGRALRDDGFPAVVAHDAACSGACALAFLGGTRAYTTGVGVGRVIEFGGKLSFAGVVASDGAGVADGARTAGQVPIEMLLGYARDMRGIEAGALIESAVAPTGRTVNRGRLIKALSIELTAISAKTPPDWFTQACRKLVGRNLSALDDAAARVTTEVKPIGSVKALRQALVGGRQDEPAIAKALASLGDSDAIDLAVGGSFYLDQRKPILDARAVQLERGGGFYMDVCVAVRSKGMLAVVLVDAVGHTAIYQPFEGGERVPGDGRRGCGSVVRMKSALEGGA